MDNESDKLPINSKKTKEKNKTNTTAEPVRNKAEVQASKTPKGVTSAETNTEMLRAMQELPMLKRARQCVAAVQDVVFAPATFIYDKTIGRVSSAFTQAQQDFLDGCKKLENSMSGRTSKSAESKSEESEESEESEKSNTTKPR